jgi:Protein of unknown function (DUF1761)
MTKRRVIGVLLAAVLSFAASSFWYSPMLFGRQFVVLSGVSANMAPDGAKIAAEILRNLLLAFVITWLIARRQTGRLSESLRLAAMLWLGFPLTLLSGSVLWQNVPLQLALIHAGDWLLKILLMTLIPWLVNRRLRSLGEQFATPRMVQSN